MRYVSRLACPTCGATYPADRVMNLCPVDNRPVQMVLDMERIKAERGPDAGWNPERRDLWRFGACCPWTFTIPPMLAILSVAARALRQVFPMRTHSPRRSAVGWRSRTRAGITRDSAAIRRSRSRIEAWR